MSRLVYFSFFWGVSLTTFSEELISDMNVVNVSVFSFLKDSNVSTQSFVLPLYVTCVGSSLSLCTLYNLVLVSVFYLRRNFSSCYILDPQFFSRRFLSGPNLKIETVESRYTGVLSINLKNMVSKG